ncbi:GAF domain-containing protein [Actinocrinis sp.]|uniref:GAF domain-containing protein n=1 Tax=Actinocrinis sp. TaxID=1920516 RepID=UPI002D492B4E|nr:GAF domain-containing protein [Actinocrinis sp.]HZP50930.1 GAF domain-containing protein [Actinocrinis sp.]
MATQATAVTAEARIAAAERADARPVVAASWRRCAAAGMPREERLLPEIRMGDAELGVYRSRHRLAPLLPLFRELLGRESDEAGYVFAVTDASGTLLWIRGHHGVRSRAERMNFVEGAAWSEREAGTNALGTALTLHRPVQIIRAEHYNPAVQPWTCAAAPIRDPRTGLVLGVVDLTGHDTVAGPYALALVRATAKAAEAQLALLPPPAPAPATMRLSALGRQHALLEVNGTAVALRPRHSEILVLLALAPEGLTGPQLAVALSEREIPPVTLRAEMSRLRCMLGGDLIASYPYALRHPVDCDFGHVLGLLADGRVAEAVDAYRGPLLPSSDAPGIVEHRLMLAQRLRAQVLSSADPAVLRHWLTGPSGAIDAAAWRALADRLPGGSAGRAQAAAKARSLAASPAP